MLVEERDMRESTSSGGFNPSHKYYPFPGCYEPVNSRFKGGMLRKTVVYVLVPMFTSTTIE